MKTWAGKIVLAFLMLVIYSTILYAGDFSDSTEQIHLVPSENSLAASATGIIKPPPHIPVLPSLFVTMPVPTKQQFWETQSMALPVANCNPSLAVPIGVGSIATGGNNISIKVGLGQFSDLVDTYLAIGAPAIDPDNLYIVTSGSIHPLSQGLEPWKKNTTGIIDEIVIGNISTSDLPAGTYDFYLAVAPAGSLSNYYLWKSSFTVTHFWKPGDIVRPGFGGTFLKSGDLTITYVSAVQVLDGAPLVKDKVTAFRVSIKSTFIYPVDVELKLNLPSDQWAWNVGNAVNILAIPQGWMPRDTWTVTINPGDNEIMLPYIPPGTEKDEVSVTNPLGTIKGGTFKGGCNIGERCAPDVRVLPMPHANEVWFSVEVDPNNKIVEADEGNNSRMSEKYYPVEVYAWGFTFVPTLVIPQNLAPRLSNVKEYAKRAIEYLLGTFPIPDKSIIYSIMPSTTIKCPDNPAEQCVYSITWDTSKESLGSFGARVRKLAEDSGYGNEFYVALPYEYFGGGVAATPDVVYVSSHPQLYEELAHEFNHVVVPRGDNYFLDCLAGFEEPYCEYHDVNGQLTRDYYCWTDGCGTSTDYCSTRTDYFCWLDNNGVQCSSDYVQKNCVATCPSLTACQTLAQQNCTGPDRIYKTNPDCRTSYPTGKGFWANKWFQIPETTEYFMGCSPFMPDPSAPTQWMRFGSSEQFCREKKRYQDGYWNLVHNCRFWGGIGQSLCDVWEEL